MNKGERIEQVEPVGSQARPGDPERARAESSEPAHETLSFIHALASEWEDDRSRPPARKAVGLFPGE